MIKLSDRLEKICSNIEPGETVADIGTDHGLLPLALFERGISPYMILTDNKPGPLEKVRDNLGRYFQRSESAGRYVVIDQTAEESTGRPCVIIDQAETSKSGDGRTTGLRAEFEVSQATLEHTGRRSRGHQTVSKIEQADDTVCFDIRMGDGLEVLDCAEVDTAVIAGMGGLLIIELLSKDQAKTRSIKKLILQPRIAGDKLRKWLVRYGYPIIRDELAMEAGRINEIITVGAYESTAPYAAVQNYISGNNENQLIPDCVESTAPCASVQKYKRGSTENQLIPDCVESTAPCAAIQNYKSGNNNNQLISDCVELLRKTGLIYEISEGLLRSKDPLLPEFLRRHIVRNNKIIAEISRSGSGDSTAKRLAELKVIRDTYTAVLEKISVFA